MASNQSICNISTAEVTELFYLKIGSTVILDNLYLYFVSSLGVVGFVLNWFLLELFSHTKFKNNPLKVYLQFYALSSLISCLIFAFQFLVRSPRFLMTSIFTYSMGVYRCKISNWLPVNFYFISVLDCIILIERSSHFNRKLKKYVALNPYLVSAIAFAICNLFFLPNFFMYDPRQDAEFKQALKNYDTLQNFTYCVRSQNILNNKIVLLVFYLFKDILVCVVQIGMSIYSIKLFNEFIRNNFASQIMYTPSSGAIIFNSTPNSNTNNDNIDTILNLIDYNSKLTKMTIFYSGYSIFTHISLIICYLAFFNDDNSIWAHSSFFVMTILQYMKFFSNFIFCLYFNGSLRSNCIFFC
jgi:hypothetical protein